MLPTTRKGLVYLLWLMFFGYVGYLLWRASSPGLNVKIKFVVDDLDKSRMVKMKKKLKFENDNGTNVAFPEKTYHPLISIQSGGIYKSIIFNNKLSVNKVKNI